MNKNKNLDKKNWKLINFSEIDKYAVTSYCAIHNIDEELNLGDITGIEETRMKDFDLITYGFPCQDISLSGKQKGFTDKEGNKTRSGLFFDALRIIEEKKPKIAIAENVKNLTSKKFQKEFDIVLTSLNEAGYNNYWKVLNAKDFGIPQNRERVFIVSIRKDIDNGMFEFPKGFNLILRLKDMLEDTVNEKYYLSDEMINKLVIKESFGDVKEIGYIKKSENGKKHQSNIVYDPDLIFRTLQASDYKCPLLIKEKTKQGYKEAYEGDGVYINRPHQKRGVVQHGMIQTLKTSGNDVGVVVSEPSNDLATKTKENQSLKIRKLSTLEYWRLMGFSDDQFSKAKKSLNDKHYNGKDKSNSQLYKQAGNSIVVDVLFYIFIELYKTMPQVFNDLKVTSLFSGIGAFEVALDRLYTLLNQMN